MSVRKAWLWCVLAAVIVAPATLAQDPDEGNDSMVPQGNLPRPKAKNPDPRSGLGPKPGHLAPVDSAPHRLPATLSRADGKPFTCTAMGLVDIATGQILYGNNLSEKMHPASCTKILTTLLALEDIEAGRAKLGDMVIISKAAATTGESGLWLQLGERMSLHDLLVGVMVRSANDASRAVAEYLGRGDAAAFIRRMNQRAVELGAVSTHFVNPHGLHMDLDGNAKGGDDHWTTPYDLLLFTMTAWKYPFFRQLCLMNGEPVSWEQMRVDPRTLKDPKQAPKPHPAYRIIPNRNKLLHRYSECVGVKTGFTKQAGACLVSAAMRGDRAVMAVTMHSTSGQDRWEEAEALLRFGLDQFHSVSLVKAGQSVQEVPVTGGLEASVPAISSEDVTVVWPRATEAPRPVFSVQKQVEAPLPLGLPLGTMLLKMPSGEVRQVGLTAGREVGRAGLLLGPWAMWLLFGLTAVGVVCYGAIAETHRRRGHLLASSGRTIDPRWTGAGQWQSGARTGLEGVADGSD